MLNNLEKSLKKTGAFYKVDNGNRVTDVYVEAPSKSQLTDIWNKAQEKKKQKLLEKRIPTLEKEISSIYKKE